MPPQSVLKASPKDRGNFAPWNYRADDYLMTNLSRMGKRFRSSFRTWWPRLEELFISAEGISGTSMTLRT
jgi:hypothetical protein